MPKKIDVSGLDHYHDKVSAMVADEYSSSATYAVGDYCFHAGTLYKCTTAITTAEAWTSGHWTAAKLAEDTSALKTALSGNTQNLLDISKIYYSSNLAGVAITKIDNNRISIDGTGTGNSSEVGNEISVTAGKTYTFNFLSDAKYDFGWYVRVYNGSTELSTSFINYTNTDYAITMPENSTHIKIGTRVISNREYDMIVYPQMLIGDTNIVYPIPFTTAVDYVLRGKTSYPEFYGAVGDGVTDDTDAISKALADNDYVVLTKKYVISSKIAIDGKHITGCGHVYPTGDIYAFGITDISKQTQVEGVTFHCDDGGGIQFDCLTVDGSNNPKPYIDYTPRQSTIIGAKFVCDNVRGSNIYGVKMVGAVDTLVDSCGFYGCGVYADSSINVGIVNSNFINADYGIYYATVATSNPAYTCGLRLVSCNIVGCTNGVYSNDTDVILIDSCMIDYCWTSVNLIQTVAPKVINSYITAYDYCIRCNNTPFVQISDCVLSDHENTVTQTPTVIFDLSSVGKGTFNNISINATVENLIKIGTVSESIFHAIIAKRESGTANLFFGNAIGSSCTISDISLKSSNINIGTGNSARVENVRFADYRDSLKGSYIITTDGTTASYVKTIDAESKLVPSGAIIGTVTGWKGDYEISFSKTNGQITVIFDSNNIPTGNLRVSYLVY